MQKNQYFFFRTKISALYHKNVFEHSNAWNIELEKLANCLSNFLSVSSPEYPQAFVHTPAYRLYHQLGIHVIRRIRWRDMYGSALAAKFVDSPQDLRDMQRIASGSDGMSAFVILNPFKAGVKRFSYI